MKVYLAGPMTGYPAWNRDAFEIATIALGHRDHEAVSPFDNGIPLDRPWAEHLRADLARLLDCDAVAVLPGWECSRGATLEVRVAQSIGLNVKPLDAWLRDG